MAWSDQNKLGMKYPGLLKTFQKLKQRERLLAEDIIPMQKFVDATITCTTNKDDIKKLLNPDGRALDWDPDCNQSCNPDSCSVCCERVALLIKESVEDVNTHHHTKTCRKQGPDCRFGIPRPPSDFTIIAQAMTEEDKKTEAVTVKGQAFIMSKVRAELKRVEEDLKERRKVNSKAEIEGTLPDMLQKLFPDVNMAANEEYIVIQGDEEEQFKVKTSLVREAWKQNPNHEKLPINVGAPRERLQSAAYHFALSIISYGTKVVLKRELKDIFVNNYNADFLKANYFVQSQCSHCKFCAETCIKTFIKKHGKLDKVGPVVTNTYIFSCFTFISPKFVQICKYFARSCDCMIAAFRNSATMSAGWLCGMLTWTYSPSLTISHVLST